MPTIVTKTVKSAGGDYTSWSNWEAAQQGDFVAADEIRQAEIYGFQDTTDVVIDGSTTDATRYMRIYAAPGAEAQMPYNATTSYRLETGGNPLIVADGFVRLERLQISAVNNNALYTDGGSDGLRVIGCYLRATGSFAGNRGAYFGAGAATAYFVNCVFEAAGDCIMVDAGTAYIYNCIAAGNSFGVAAGFNRSAGTAIVKNCLVTNATTDFSGAFDAASDYNASEDATAPGAHSRTGQTFTFAGAGDYHLASSDAGAKDFGTNLSADATYPFSDDFDGVVRSGTWDIGPDEFVPLVSPITTPQSVRVAPQQRAA